MMEKRESWTLPGGLTERCLNEHRFGSLPEARAVNETWRMDYSQARPHRALGYRTWEEFAAEQAALAALSRCRLDSPRVGPISGGLAL